MNCASNYGWAWTGSGTEASLKSIFENIRTTRNLDDLAKGIWIMGPRADEIIRDAVEASSLLSGS